MSFIKADILKKAMTYAEYRELIDSLIKQGKTTGVEQSEEKIEFTSLNVHRMNRLDKTIKIIPFMTEPLENMSEKQVWVVLTEAWCGDAAQNIPVLEKIAACSENIELRLLLRDEHPELMDRYLTNGGRAVPKLISLNAESLKELWTWGPRPEPAQAIMKEFKERQHQTKEQTVIDIQKWYAKDKGVTLQKEILFFLANDVIG